MHWGRYALVVGGRLILTAFLLTALWGLSASPRTSENTSSESLLSLPAAVAESGLTREPVVYVSREVSAGADLEWPDLFGDTDLAAAVAEVEDSDPALPTQSETTPAPAQTASPVESKGAPERIKPQPGRGLLLAEVSEPAQEPVAVTPPSKPVAQTLSQPEPGNQTATDTVADAESNKPDVTGWKIVPEGSFLVVYDPQGNEIYRRSRDSDKHAVTAEESRSVETKPETVDQSTHSPSESATVDRVRQTPEKTVETARVTPPTTPLFVEVRKGDTLSTIARRYKGVSATDLIRANEIDDPHRLQIGRKIWVPQGREGVCYTARRGDTLTQVLKRYQVKGLFDVCDLNGLKRTTSKLEPGQQIILPGAEPREVWNGVERIAVAGVFDGLRAAKQGWNWPTEKAYRISSPYGRRADPFSKRSDAQGGSGKKQRPRYKMHHGVDFALPVGTRVLAARDGEVVEVVHSRWGYGNMIKVRHDNGMYSLYAHNSKILRKVGDRVKQGECIALSGNTGRSTGPHLHFELRNSEQKSVNPASILGPPPKA